MSGSAAALAWRGKSKESKGIGGHVYACGPAVPARRPDPADYADDGDPRAPCNQCNRMTKLPKLSTFDCGRDLCRACDRGRIEAGACYSCGRKHEGAVSAPAAAAAVVKPRKTKTKAAQGNSNEDHKHKRAKLNAAVAAAPESSSASALAAASAAVDAAFVARLGDDDPLAAMWSAAAPRDAHSMQLAKAAAGWQRKTKKKPAAAAAAGAGAADFGDDFPAVTEEPRAAPLTTLSSAELAQMKALWRHRNRIFDLCNAMHTHAASGHQRYSELAANEASNLSAHLQMEKLYTPKLLPGWESEVA